jgi:hypothetical protein
MPEQATGLQIIAGAQQPGLFDLLRADSPPDDDLREAAEDFLADPQVQDTDLADLALSSSDDTAGVTFGLGDWWRNILYTFEPLVFTVEDVETKDVPIAAYWVTVPEVAGAKVTLTRTSGTSRERAASLKILGIGGGPTFTGEIALTDSFEADDSQKIELLVSATFERVRAQKRDDVLARFVRLASIDWNNTGITREPQQPPDPAGWGSPMTIRNFHLSKVDDLSTESVKVAAGTSWENTAGLTVNQLDVSLSATVTYQQEVTYETSLPGGHDYVASLYRAFPAYLWQVED